jgi:endonuclease-8
MPEGDSIHLIARQLAPLVGQVIERATTQGLVRDLAGRTISAVTVHGKHLLVDLDDGHQLRVHLGMNGRFRMYARAEGEAIVARTSPGNASLVLATATQLVVWRTARTIEITARRAPSRGLAVAALGPDVLAADFDPAVAAASATGHPTRLIADVLLDQRVAAGIGNIWKTESLFACQIDPRTPVAALSVEQLSRLYAAAAGQMRASVDRGRPGAYGAYSRTGQPCPRCDSPISAYQLGDPPRWTWSCPACQIVQKVPGSEGSSRAGST